MSIRSALSRRAVRAAAVAGVAAAALGTAGIASASTAAAPHVDGFAPTEQCLNWSGTVDYFPKLTTTSHSVTATISGTLSNCNFEGTDQTYSGTVFGVLTGTATTTAATLTGNVAVTWPADSGLDPTISPISVSTADSTYSFYGTPTAGAGTGAELSSAWAKIGQTKINGGTQESILGSAPFEIEVNDG